MLKGELICKQGWDEHLGLYEFGFRLYDPWAGVGLTRESLPAQDWEPRTWHRYQYAYASPISYYDPYGLQVPPPECKPGEICYTGTLGPYNVQAPLPSVPTVVPAETLQAPAPVGATSPECTIEPWPPLLRGYRFLRAGRLQGGVFVGEPPWIVPEESPDTKVAPGWLGWLELFFNLFSTYVEPWARAHYIRSQPPNVVAELIYHEYEEGLQPAGLILENRSGEWISAQWVVIIPETGKGIKGNWVTLKTEGFESTKWVEIQLPPGWEPIPPHYSVDVEVWFKAPVPPFLTSISFTLPPGVSGAEPYVAR